MEGWIHWQGMLHKRAKTQWIHQWPALMTAWPMASLYHYTLFPKSCAWGARGGLFLTNLSRLPPNETIISNLGSYSEPTHLWHKSSMKDPSSFISGHRDLPPWPLECADGGSWDISGGRRGCHEIHCASWDATSFLWCIVVGHVGNFMAWGVLTKSSSLRTVQCTG